MNYIRRSFTYNGKRYCVYGKTEREAIEKLVLKRVSEVRILFGTPVQNTAILTSCSVLIFYQHIIYCQYLSLFIVIGVLQSVLHIVHNLF